MSQLSEPRPRTPSSGWTIPHESAALHVTGLALYTDDLVDRAPRTSCTPSRCRRRTPTPGSPRCGPRRRCDVPGVVRVLTAGRRARASTTPGVKHDEPLFPDEVMFYGHAVCWVLGETLEAARLGAAAVEVEYEPLPSLVTVAEAIAAESFQGARPTVRARRRRGRRSPAAPHVFSGEFEFAGQEHFYLETHCRAGARSTRTARSSSSRSTQHPSETQEIVAHVLGLPSHEVTVQCLRMGGGFGGKEMQPHGFAAIAALGATPHRPPGAAAAEPHPGHDDDRQAARLPRRSGGSASTPTAGCRRSTRP